MAINNPGLPWTCLAVNNSFLAAGGITAQDCLHEKLHSFRMVVLERHQQPGDAIAGIGDQPNHLRRDIYVTGQNFLAEDFSDLITLHAEVPPSDAGLKRSSSSP